MKNKKHKAIRLIGIVCLIMLLLAIPDMLPVSNEVDDEEIHSLLKEIKDFPDDVILWEELGIIYHDLARDHQSDARLGLEPLKKSLALDYNAYVESYLGSTYTLIGRDAFSPVLKLVYVWIGLWHQDRAVKNSGGSMLPRIIRMENNRSLPFFFFRSSVVSSDMEILKETDYDFAENN